MAISSVGAGSGVLTQDILDKLREADDAQNIRPLELSIANENDREQALKIVDASMTNLIDSINALKDPTLFQERSATVAGTSVEVNAAINSDTQDFTLKVTQLATKRVEESGTFSNAAYPVDPDAKYDPTIDSIATGPGTLQFNVTGMDIPIEIIIDATTTLDDLKKAINDQAGDYAEATIVQVSDGEYNLFISSAETGAAKEISITDADSALIGTQLTTEMNAIVGAEGKDAKFDYNGQSIVRESNKIDDLVAGLSITLKEEGSSLVSVKQDNESILEKIDSFVAKYNETITELDKMTNASTDSETRGIFSGDSTIRSMRSYITNMITDTSSGSMFDYGFELDKEGKLSIDKAEFTEKLENDNTNTQAFLAGGTYTDENGISTEIDGAFTSFSTTIETYTKYDAILDQMKDYIGESKDTLEDRKSKAIENLDSKYETMQKRFIAYDLMMSRINSASSMFTQMANASSDY